MQASCRFCTRACNWLTVPPCHPLLASACLHVEFHLWNEVIANESCVPSAHGGGQMARLWCKDLGLWHVQQHAQCSDTAAKDLT